MEACPPGRGFATGDRRALFSNAIFINSPKRFEIGWPWRYSPSGRGPVSVIRLNERLGIGGLVTAPARPGDGSGEGEA